MRQLMLGTLLLVASVGAEEMCTKHGGCDNGDEGGAKYSREKNQPGSGLHSRIAVLQGALMSLMKDPYNPDVLRSSLAELADFAETAEGQKFLDSFTDMMSGKNTGGPGGAMVKQLFTSVLAGNVDLGGLMKNGINAQSLASLAGGFLNKDKSGSGVKSEDLVPLLKNFLQVIKEEQASPFLLDKLSKAFEETMPLDKLKQFEKSAAGVLGSIRAATEEDDSNFVYDQATLDTFMSYIQDFAEEHEWDWKKNGPTLVREIKKVMRMFQGSEDQMGRLLPSVLEVIADDKPSKKHLQEIIDNFGGVFGIVVKKDNADPDLVLQITDKLRAPLKTTPTAESDQKTKTSETNPEVKQEQLEEAEKETSAKAATGGMPDISKLVESFGELTKNPAELQKIAMEVMSKGRDFDLKELGDLLPRLEGMDEVTAYLNRVQSSSDEREIAGHFHSLMDVIGDTFDVLNSQEVRHGAIQQALPYIRMVHDFLKEPMALFKIQMGIASVTSMYQTTTDELVQLAAPYIEETLTPIGIKVNFKEFAKEAQKYLLKAYHNVYQSPKSALKKLNPAQVDEYIVEAIDHSVGEPIVLVFDAYKMIRKSPDCLLQALCSINRKSKSTDEGELGVRPAFTKGLSRVFGLLLATSEHGIDSPVHEQIAEAVDEGHTDGNCERRFPDCSTARE